MSPDQPVTRAELNVALESFGLTLEAKIVGETTSVMRDIETNLLTAFHSYARGNAARLTAMDVTDRELRIRMDELENRVVALETRRPPPRNPSS
jgi:BMFP domain-containing protein YqiC